MLKKLCDDKIGTTKSRPYLSIHKSDYKRVIFTGVSLNAILITQHRIHLYMLIVFNKINAADKLGLPSPPPYLSIPKSDYKKIILTGVSFASGGSGILSGSYDTPVRFLFFYRKS